jgi:hypothetical protein
VNLDYILAFKCPYKIRLGINNIMEAVYMISLDTKTQDTMSLDTKLKNEILKLESILKKKRDQLFLMRLVNMLDKGLYDTISEVKIEVGSVDFNNPKSARWNISYKHHTKEYDPLDYLYENDTPQEEIPNNKMEKITFVSFGKSDRYFIKGGVKYNIYNNSKGELRIVNADYDSELDIEEQCQLINDYSKNKNIPECLALQIFLYMSYNKWDDMSMAIHLSIV